MADSDQLDRVEFARLAGYGSPGTVTRLVHRARQKRADLVAGGDQVGAESPSLFPEPDGHVGRTPYWWRSTVERYLENRTQLGGGGWLPGPGDGQDDDAGPGTCPVCERAFISVSSHRRRRAACSYDDATRAAARAAAGATEPAVLV